MVKSVAAWVASFEEEISGIVVFSGGKSTVSVIISALVL